MDGTLSVNRGYTPFLANSVIGELNNLKITGLGDLEKQLKNIEKNIKREVEGEVSLRTLFSNEFLKEHTNFDSFESFEESLPVQLKEQSDLDNIDKNKVDPFIKEKTKFDSWDDLAEAAAALYAKKKIDKLI